MDIMLQARDGQTTFAYKGIPDKKAGDVLKALYDAAAVPDGHKNKRMTSRQAVSCLNSLLKGQETQNRFHIAGFGQFPGKKHDATRVINIDIAVRWEKKKPVIEAMSICEPYDQHEMLRLFGELGFADKLETTEPAPAAAVAVANEEAPAKKKKAKKKKPEQADDDKAIRRRHRRERRIRAAEAVAEPVVVDAADASTDDLLAAASTTMPAAPSTTPVDMTPPASLHASGEEVATVTPAALKASGALASGSTSPALRASGVSMHEEVNSSAAEMPAALKASGALASGATSPALRASGASMHEEVNSSAAEMPAALKASGALASGATSPALRASGTLAASGEIDLEASSELTTSGNPMNEALSVSGAARQALLASIRGLRKSEADEDIAALSASGRTAENETLRASGPGGGDAQGAKPNVSERMRGFAQNNWQTGLLVAVASMFFKSGMPSQAFGQMGLQTLAPMLAATSWTGALVIGAAIAIAFKAVMYFRDSFAQKSANNYFGDLGAFQERLAKSTAELNAARAGMQGAESTADYVKGFANKDALLNMGISAAAQYAATHAKTNPQFAPFLELIRKGMQPNPDGAANELSESGVGLNLSGEAEAEEVDEVLRTSSTLRNS